MKKLIALFTAVVFALTLGVAFAQETTPAAGEKAPAAEKAPAKAKKKAKKAKKAKKEAKKEAAKEEAPAAPAGK